MNKRKVLLLGIGIIAISTSASIVIQKIKSQKTSSTKAEHNLIELNEESGINTKDYEILWVEDFNNDTLDESKWEYELGSIRGIEQQHYVNNPENVFIRNNENGKELVLKATDRPKELHYINPRSAGTKDERKVIYNSASVRTHGKAKFLYGRIEIRAKLPKGKGVFPAFWTLGADNTINGNINKSQGYGWPRCGEIDIMELIGGKNGYDANKEVYQTIHLADTSDQNTYKKLAGTKYRILEDFYDDYHIFGINWNKGKMEWYVDDKIVSSVDYSDDPIASKALNRPQYIQLNLAMGGAWPGKVAENLGNTPESEFAIDYVYYAQNKQQKADAKEYYKNAPQIIEAEDIVMYEGKNIDLLSSVKVSSNADVDFSISDCPSFFEKEKNATNENPISKVSLVHKGKTDAAEKLSKLPAGEYILYYTALPKGLKLDENELPDGKEEYKFDRKSVKLTITKQHTNKK